MKRRHTREELRELLGVAEAEPEPAIRRVEPRTLDAPPVSALPPAPETAAELFVLWSAARAEANLAYDAWCDRPGAEGYLVYRAAEDRADAAESSLARLSAAA